VTKIVKRWLWGDYEDNDRYIYLRRVDLEVSVPDIFSLSFSSPNINAGTFSPLSFSSGTNVDVSDTALPIFTQSRHRN
jgi:hypothetical protein